SLAYHFGVKLRFYPSSKQKKIIKLNYDAQRFVYNSYVGRNRSSYHAKRYLANRQNRAMPFAFSALNSYEVQLAETVVINNELLAKPKNIRDAYSFLRVKEIDS
ncbi:helix-turn-helix domain-containing protein, partial [Lactobacillus amylovorus]|uniref:helix-turn-helix domain-containing protein n=3 Tax=Bacilli TaxID=91061 RepID=UPI003F8E4E50